MKHLYDAKTFGYEYRTLFYTYHFKRKADANKLKRKRDSFHKRIMHYCADNSNKLVLRYSCVPCVTEDCKRDLDLFLNQLNLLLSRASYTREWEKDKKYYILISTFCRLCDALNLVQLGKRARVLLDVAYTMPTSINNISDFISVPR